MPLAETQMATVLSNADPQGKGRVRVRMNWQTDGMQTGWVRVMTPDGGSSSDVKSNRGFVFIPEVGDQVLLGFRHGDPARPYVTRVRDKKRLEKVGNLVKNSYLYR